METNDTSLSTHSSVHAPFDASAQLDLPAPRHEHTRSRLDAQQRALVDLGRALQREGYHFTAVTPFTHHLVRARAATIERVDDCNLRDVFGWNTPFAPSALPSAVRHALFASRQFRVLADDRMISAVRFSTLQQRIFVHSSFPTDTPDAVFFGPDTYRFCSLLRSLNVGDARYIVDVGTGSGAGAITLAAPGRRVVAVDLNERALRLSAVNAALANVSIELVHGDVLDNLSGQPDLIVANPPYLRDPSHRMYRDGGGDRGEALSLRIVREALARLAVPGQLVMYTGSAIVRGVDSLSERVTSLVRNHARNVQCDFQYEELDPDVFGEELAEPLYRDVERIAVVALRIAVS